MTPSNLSSKKQQQILDSSKQFAINHKIKNSLWNVELWLKDDKIIITEINGRSASVWENIYKNVFNLSIYEAMISVAQGKFVVSPEQETTTHSKNCYGAQFHITSHKDGHAEKIFNFDIADQIGAEINIKLFISPKHILSKTQTSGNKLAFFELYGTDVEKLYKQANRIREQLLV